MKILPISTSSPQSVLPLLALLLVALTTPANSSIVSFDCARLSVKCLNPGVKFERAQSPVRKGIQDVIFGNSFECFSLLGVAGTTLVNIPNKTIDLYGYLDDLKSRAGAMGQPGEIAGWTAANFGYFDPLAELIQNPSVATSMPRLEPIDLFAKAGPLDCRSK